MGRTDNNDIALPDNSVSRFHAYFQQGPATHAWKLIDAESSNGTFVGDQRLEPNKGRLLAGGSVLRFGDVAVRFMPPATFRDYLARRLLAVDGWGGG